MGKEGTGPERGLQGHFPRQELSGNPPPCSLHRAWGLGVGVGRSLEGNGYKVCPWRWVLGEQSSALPPPGLDSSV